MLALKIRQMSVMSVKVMSSMPEHSTIRAQLSASLLKKSNFDEIESIWGKNRSWISQLGRLWYPLRLFGVLDPKLSKILYAYYMNNPSTRLYLIFQRIHLTIEDEFLRFWQNIARRIICEATFAVLYCTTATTFQNTSDGFSLMYGWDCTLQVTVEWGSSWQILL